MASLGRNADSAALNRPHGKVGGLQSRNSLYLQDDDRGWTADNGCMRADRFALV